MRAVEEALEAQGRGDELRSANASLAAAVGGSTWTAPPPAGVLKKKGSKVVIAEVSDSEDSDSDEEDVLEPEPEDEEEEDPDLIPHPDDAKTREGLVGWLDEQQSNFRVDKEYRARMLARYGSKGGHLKAVQDVVARYAAKMSRAPLNTRAPRMDIEKRMDVTDGKAGYKKAVGNLNAADKGPTLADPAKIGADTLAGKGRAEKALENERMDAMKEAEAAGERGDKDAMDMWIDKVDSLDSVLGRVKAVAKPRVPPSAEEQTAQAAKAEVLKDEGNGAFQQGQHTKAIEIYTAALSALGDVMDVEKVASSNATKVAVHNNRAMAFLQSGRASACVADASVVLGLEPENSKALFRRALARRQLGGAMNSSMAVKDLERVVAVQPKNAAAQRELVGARSDARAAVLAGKSTATKRPAAAVKQQPRRVAVIEADTSDDSDDDEGDEEMPALQARCDAAAAPQQQVKEAARRVVVEEDSDESDSDDEEDELD